VFLKKNSKNTSFPHSLLWVMGVAVAIGVVEKQSQGIGIYSVFPKPHYTIVL
jgi:hypothetical protein